MGPGREQSSTRHIFCVVLLFLPNGLNEFPQMAMMNRTPVWQQWAVDVVIYPVLLGVLLFLCSRRKLIDIRRFGLLAPGFTNDLLLAVWPAAFLLLVCRLGVRTSLGALLLPDSWSFGWNLPGKQPWRLLVAVYAAVTAGFFEEIIYRGFITVQLRKILSSRNLGALLSAVLFAAAHWGQGLDGMLTALVFGLLIQAYYDIYDNMRCAILVHALYDLWVFF